MDYRMLDEMAMRGVCAGAVCCRAAPRAGVYYFGRVSCVSCWVLCVAVFYSVGE